MQVTFFQNIKSKFMLHFLKQFVLYVCNWNLIVNIFNVLISFFNFCRENYTVIGFQFTLRNYVLEIKQSGTGGRLPSAVMRVMATCVYQTKNSRNCQSFVISRLFYGCRNVSKYYHDFRICVIITNVAKRELFI